MEKRGAQRTNLLDPLVLTTRSSGILGAFAPGTAPGLPLVSTVSPHLTPPYFMLRAMSAASPRTPRPGREFGARGGPGSAGDRAGVAARGWSGTPRGSSVAYPNISAGPSNFHRDTGCRSERPRRPVTLTQPLIAYARATGGGPECPVDFAPRYCYANSNEMSSGTLVLATCPPLLPHPECGLQDTVGICLKGSRPASSLAGCAADGFGFLPQHLFRTLVPQAVVRVFSRFLLLRLAGVSAPLPHPECGLQDTCISISTGLESSRPTSSLTGSGMDGHRNHEQRRENSQDGLALVGPLDSQA
jgi:hypothetical protein